MGCGKMPVRILDEMEEFDQKVALTRSVAEKRLNFCQGTVVQLAAFRRVAALSAARLPNAFVVFIQCH